MLDLSSRKVYGALAEQCVGGDTKADKVETAVAGHLAGLDANGNLTDSGVSPTEDVTVEGNPITFESPFEQDAKSVVVSVKPIQDLHGYDYPWPAGGGKNKLPLVFADIKANNTDGTWSGNVYSVANGTIEIMTDDADNVTGIKANGTFNNDVYFNINEPIITGTLRLTGCPSGGDFNTTYALYQFRPSIGAIANDSGGGADIDVQANDAIWIVIRNGASVSNAIFKPMVSTDMSATYATFAPYSNICPISGIDEVEIGVSDGEGEPTTTTIPLPSTLYGGDVDVTNGDATSDVTKINCKNLNFSISTSGGGLHWVDLSSKTDIEPISDKMEYLNVGDGWNSTIPCISKNSDNEVRIYGSSEFFADGGSYENAEVLYQLITPTTISFDPTDVELLEGTNVVSTNAEKVAVTYGRSLWQDIDKLKTDTEGKLDKSDVADIEGDTASRAYSVNEFMLRSDGFYKVTQPIAQNASITANNTTKTTVGEVLTALLNA